MIARAGPFKVLMSEREHLRNIRTLNNFVEPFVDEALALPQDDLEKRTKGDQGYTFLHAIASYTRDRQVLRDQLVNVLLAGRDTTACTLSWLFWELSHQPQIVEDLRQEIQERLGFTRKPSYDDLKNMKMLQHTLNEILRLYPVVPFNIRVALKDTTLPQGGGPDGNDPVGVLKDTPIGYSTHYMQLTPEIYPPVTESFPPPEQFAPRRWESWNPKHWTYIPFNGGPRICVGQNFALMEMAYTVVRILQTFSRVESRIAGGPGRVKGLSGLGAKLTPISPNWERSNGRDPDLVERAVGPRDRMVSEIVLQPGNEVRVAFWK